MSGLREKKKKESEEKIKKIAKEIFLSKSYLETTMEEIAQKAEIGVGTLYNYFKSKDEIYIAIMSEEFILDEEDSEQLEISLENDVAKTIIDFIWKSCKGLKLMGKKVWKELMTAVLSSAKSNNFLFKGMVKLDYKFIKRLKILLEKIKDKEQLTPSFNTDEAAYAIYSVVMAQFILYLYSEDITYDALTTNIEHQIRFIFEGKCTR
ncbi:MAG TPA: TetR/AcrR family transcriptional regulator [Desulfosporosinus sp.]|nr:TetR/AcrR family transcriptional regulator [Desulfosporosinus sp.]